MAQSELGAEGAASVAHADVPVMNPRYMQVLESGPGADLRIVPKIYKVANQSHGGHFGSFVQACGLVSGEANPPGTPFLVVPMVGSAAPRGTYVCNN